METERKKDGKVFVWPVDPLLKELCKHRRETAHYCPLWIKPEKVKSTSEYVI